MRFFNGENSSRALAQAYNAVALTYAAYSFLTNPEATLSEFGLHAAVHAFNIYSLQEGSHALTDLSAAALNFAGMGSVYARATSGCTSLPMMASVVDGMGLLFCAATSIVTSKDSESKENAPKPN